MNNDEKKELILKFINGPLQQYLLGDISFGKFKELINETCGTDFIYSDLYPSYLFNLQVAQTSVDVPAPTVILSKFSRQSDELSDFDKKMRICHQYGLCIQSDVELYMCGTCDVCPRTKEQSKAFKKGELE
jgi:hypothetical protein